MYDERREKYNLTKFTMVGVAQLVEPWIVIPVVVGSSPIIHPIFKPLPATSRGFYFSPMILATDFCTTKVTKNTKIVTNLKPKT